MLPVYTHDSQPPAEEIDGKLCLYDNCAGNYEYQALEVTDGEYSAEFFRDKLTSKAREYFDLFYGVGEE